MAGGGRIRRGVGSKKARAGSGTPQTPPSSWDAGGAADRARRAGSTAAPPKMIFELRWVVFWVVWGASFGVVGAVWACLAPLGGFLEAIWRLLGASWGHLRSILLFFGYLGGVLGTLSCGFGRFVEAKRPLLREPAQEQHRRSRGTESTNFQKWAFRRGETLDFRIAKFILEASRGHLGNFLFRIWAFRRGETADFKAKRVGSSHNSTEGRAVIAMAGGGRIRRGVGS